VFALPGRRNSKETKLSGEGGGHRCDGRIQLNDPKKKNKNASGKKRPRCKKSQVVVDQETKQIICTAYGNSGKNMTFDCLNDQIQTPKDVECLADKGYIKVFRSFTLSRTPKARKSGCCCTKWLNRGVGSTREVVSCTYCEFSKNVSVCRSAIKSPPTIWIKVQSNCWSILFANSFLQNKW